MAAYAAAVVAFVLVAAFPQQAPPRDPVVRPGLVLPATSSATPEAQKKIDELRQQARQLQAAGDFDGAVAALEAAAQMDPNNPAGHQLVATYYLARAQNDKTITTTQRATYIHEGIAATDRALSVNPDYLEALTYKSILLRMQANLEPDVELKARLVAEADALRSHAMELNRTRAGASAGGGVMSPGVVRQAQTVDGMAPVRVGGNIKPPAKIKDVRPFYPADALAARIQGVVIIEATIDITGKVQNAVVLRSIPLLDEAALEAVRQWEFTPTYVNDAPVPVIMTVTVNFTLGTKP